MSNSQTSNIKFWAVAAVTLLAAAGAVVMLWPSALEAAHHESGRLTTTATQASGGESAADYQLAVWLNPSNQTAYAGLATAQISAGQSTAALASLSRAGQGTDVSVLKIRALIEAGNYAQAGAQTPAITGANAPDSNLVLAALADSLANQPTAVAALAARVTSPQAVQSIARAQVGNLPLATQLYASGLLNSSSALLTKLPASYQRNLLLARIDYTRHTAADLNVATALLTQAIAANPSGLPARQLLVQVYRDQGNTQGLATQATLVAKLQAGHP